MKVNKSNKYTEGQVVIVHGRETGAIKTASVKVGAILSLKNIMHLFFNMSDQGTSMLQRIFNSYKILKNHSKNDLFIFMHFDPILVGLLLGMGGFKNKINVIHTDLVEYYRSISVFRKIILWIALCFLRKEKLVFVSKEAELKAKAYFYLKNTHAIYNIYNFESGLQSVTPRRPIITLGSVARLHPVKNIDLLIRVVDKLIKEGCAIELLIYGAGPEEQRLKDYVSNFGLKESVKFKGEVFDKDVIYNSIDALVSFSSYEGFGMTILESADYGKPVFYTDCSSGPREIMAPNTDPLQKTTSFDETSVGFLVKPVLKLNPYAINLTLDEIKYTHYLRKFVNRLIEGGFSMGFDPSRFSEEKIAVQWESVINELGGYSKK